VYDLLSRPIVGGEGVVNITQGDYVEAADGAEKGTSERAGDGPCRHQMR